MKKTVTTVKSLFIVFQVVILLVGTLLVGVFVAYQSSNQSYHLWMDNIDKIAQLVTQHIKVKNENIVGQENSDYLIYVLAQKDGAYVFEPPKRSPEAEALWERYSTKLIYEMQKQKQGWIFYPDKVNGHLKGSQRVIRYIPIDELGWIVALEIDKRDDYSKLKNILDVKFFLLLLFVVGAGTATFGFLTNKNFEIMRKLISESVESSLLTLNNEEFFHPQNSSLREHIVSDGSLQKNDSSLEGGGEIAGSVSLKKDAQDSSQAELKSPFNLSSAKEFNSFNHKSEVSLSQESSGAHKMDQQSIDENKLKNQDIEQKVVTNREADSSNLQGVTINLQNIKSNVLKKIIADFREKK